jgi:hypothetical protein
MLRRSSACCVVGKRRWEEDGRGEEGRAGWARVLPEIGVTAAAGGRWVRVRVRVWVVGGKGEGSFL